MKSLIGLVLLLIPFTSLAVQLEWDPSESPEVDGYELYVSRSGAPSQTNVGDVTTTSVSDFTGVYTARVRAYDTDQTPTVYSEWSNTVTWTITTEILPPTNLRIQ